MPQPKRMPKSWHTFAHYTPYHVNNSYRGIDKAHDAGYTRMDIDALMTLDGVMVAAHWDRPLAHGFRDPLGKTARDRLIRTMSFAHVKRLRAGEGYRINGLANMIRYAHDRGITVEVDAKADKRFEESARWEKLRDAIGGTAGVLVKTTSDLPGAHRRLAAAKAAGFTTAILPRGTRRLRRSEYWRSADYVRGPVFWFGGDGRYQRVEYAGRHFDRWTLAALRSAERQLGYRLHIAQGSYNAGGVGASAGTHDGGGAVDVTTSGDWDKAVVALRQNGFAAWHRTPAQGKWGHHIHGILIGNDRASASAKRQVDSYRRGRNGLRGDGPDDGPRVTIREYPW